jgi:hypothetical protein
MPWWREQRKLYLFIFDLFAVWILSHKLPLSVSQKLLITFKKSVSIWHWYVDTKTICNLCTKCIHYGESLTK